MIYKLEQAQEVRPLSSEELWLRGTLKLALLGLALLERTIARQNSRIRWIWDGDANNHLFQAVADGRRSKNFILYIKLGDDIITEQSRKEEFFSDAFENLLGSAQAREHSLDLEYLYMAPVNLQEL